MASGFEILERFTAEGEWVASSALHPGGEEQFGQNVDMALARDGRGRFYIPGSSVAGAARSFLTRAGTATFRGFQSGEEPKAVGAMFGRSLGMHSSEAAYASLVQVHEAVCAAGVCGWVRDKVRIDAESGTARTRGKFNMEVLPAGTSFPLRLQLTVYRENPNQVSRTEILDAFGRMLRGFEGDIRLGGQTRRGLGSGRVRTWRIRRFDMTERGHATDWLAHRGWQGGETVASPSDLIDGVVLEPRERMTVQLTLALRGPMLVRGGLAGAGSPDFVQFQENGQPIIPGSALTGALRHRAGRVARTLWGSENGGRAVRLLFGPLAEETRTLEAGRLEVSEAPLRNGRMLVQSRVRIDRFTGGSIEAALFDEAPFWPDPKADSHCDLRLTLDGSLDSDEAWLVTLLIQTLKDLWLGDLAVGGESGIGRGTFEGRRAVIQYPGLSDLILTRSGGAAEVRVEGWSQAWAHRVEAGIRDFKG